MPRRWPKGYAIRAVSDLLLVDRDLPPAGETWRQTGGAQLAAQNIIEAIGTPYGSLPWDREAGSYLSQWQNSVIVPSQIVDELERVALTIEHVQPESVEASYDAPTDTYSLSFVGPNFERGTIVAEPHPAPPEPTPAPAGGPLLLIGPNMYLLVRPGEALAV